MRRGLTAGIRGWIGRCAIAACLAPNLAAAADDAESLSEVSYLVFNRAQGFDRPTITLDTLRGTIDVRFAKVPAQFKGLLAPQIATERKAKFFKGFQPLEVKGRLVGVSVQVGLPDFEVSTYKKSSPSRWVMRLGRPRTSDEGGALPVPVVPYADLVDVDAAGRGQLAAAERSLEAALTMGSDEATRVLKSGDACGAFHALLDDKGADPEVLAFTALRAADCYWRAGEVREAQELLEVAPLAAFPVAERLALARTEELSGAVLATNADPKAQIQAALKRPGFTGPPAAELQVRAARAYLLRGERVDALKMLDGLATAQTLSATYQFADARDVLRRRTMEEAAASSRWSEVASLHLGITLPERSPKRHVDLELLAAHANREIGLPAVATRLYLGLIQGKRLGEQGAPSEVEVTTWLAETYLESSDALRAEVAIRFLEERLPGRAGAQSAVLGRLRTRLALLQKKPRELETTTAPMAAVATSTSAPARGVDAAGATSRELAGDGAEDEVNTTTLSRAASVALQVEGVAAARRILAPHAARVSGADTLSRIARDLAAAARDCDALAVYASPIELASAEDLLLTGLCLLGEGHLDDALVLVEAAQVYAASELASPDNALLLDTVREQALFWLKAPAPAPVSAAVTASTDPDLAR